MRAILNVSRYLVLVPVFGILLTSMMAFLYAGIATVKLISSAFLHSGFDHAGAKHFAVEMTELIDLFLLGTVLYIIAMGLHQLFIDEELPMPKWLRFESLDDLKVKLIGVTVVLMGVSFLGEVVDWEGGPSIMYLGVGIAVVMLAFAPVLYLHRHSPPHREDDGV